MPKKISEILKIKKNINPYFQEWITAEQCTSTRTQTTISSVSFSVSSLLRASTVSCGSKSSKHTGGLLPSARWRQPGFKSSWSILQPVPVLFCATRCGTATTRPDKLKFFGKTRTKLAGEISPRIAGCCATARARGSSESRFLKEKRK